jgi:hypothetical protein
VFTADTHHKFHPRKGFKVLGLALNGFYFIRHRKKIFKQLFIQFEVSAAIRLCPIRNTKFYNCINVDILMRLRLHVL